MKVRAGQPLKIAASEKNAWDDAALAHKRQVLGGTHDLIHFYHPRDKLRLKNNTGGDLVAGRVLQVGTSLFTPFNPRHFWLNGETPDPDGTDEILILNDPIPDGDINWCQGAGYCLAQVDIVHEQHQYADVEEGSTLLKSMWHGRARIVKRSSSGTGTKECLVNMGRMFRGPIKGVTTEAINPCESGDVKVYWGGTTNPEYADPESLVTVWWNHMAPETADPIPTDIEVLFGWEPSEQKYFMWNAACQESSCVV